jgi:hypothetical protein
MSRRAVRTLLTAPANARPRVLRGVCEAALRASQNGRAMDGAPRLASGAGAQPSKAEPGVPAFVAYEPWMAVMPLAKIWGASLC